MFILIPSIKKKKKKKKRKTVDNMNWKNFLRKFINKKKYIYIYI